MGIPFLVSERLYLRALEESDADGPYLSWFNDDEVCKGNSHHAYPFTREMALAYIHHSLQTPDELIQAIILTADNRHIGNIALQHIHPIYHSAELSIVIGDKSAWGKGYAREASQLLCMHGFSTLNLERIACATFDDNNAMRKLALALGMVEEGRRRSAAFKNGRIVDIIEFGVLRNEFNKTIKT